MVIIDIIIWLIAAAVVLAVCATAFSIYRSLRTNRRRQRENSIPVGIIDWAVAAAVVILCAVTWLTASFTDMCLITAAVMLMAAAAAVIYDKLKKRRAY